MMEWLHVANDAQQLIHAFGGLSLVEKVRFAEYFGLPAFSQEGAEYVYHYASGNVGFSGACAQVAEQLQCQSHVVNGDKINLIKEMIPLGPNGMKEAVLDYCQEQIRQVHITIDLNQSNPVELINAFKYN